MTTEELIAAGLPVDPVVEGGEHAAPTEDTGSPSGSRSREDGEVQSDDGEDIGDVDAGVSDLVRAKTSGPLPPSLDFGESKVTTNMIRDNSTTPSTRVVPSTPIGRTPERESPEFRLLPAASLTSPRTGTLIGFI
jgi:hypothetical protein